MQKSSSLAKRKRSEAAEEQAEQKTKHLRQALRQQGHSVSAVALLCPATVLLPRSQMSAHVHVMACTRLWVAGVPQFVSAALPQHSPCLALLICLLWLSDSLSAAHSMYRGHVLHCKHAPSSL